MLSWVDLSWASALPLYLTAIKLLFAYVKKGGYQKDKIETRVAQNKENKNPDALLLEIQISMIVMKNSMEVLQKLNV